MFDLNVALKGRSYDEFVDSILEWQQQVFQMVTTSRPDLADEVRFYGHVPLELLPVRDRMMMMGKYRDLIGFDDLLEAYGTNKASALNDPNLDRFLSKIGQKLGSSKKTRIENMLSGMMRYSDGESAFGRLSISGDYSSTPLVERIYRNINVQLRDYFSQAFSGFEGPMQQATASRFLGFGAKSIGIISQYDKAAPVFDPSMLSGKKFTIFDLETAGLDAGQIRELSYATEAGAQETIRLRPRQFRRGRIGYQDPVTGEFLSRSLEDEVASQLPASHAAKYLSAPSDGLGDNFLDGIQPFLERIQNSDYIIGQNISKFDVENLFVSIARTSRYKNDTQYKQYIDDIYDDIIKNNKIVDTLDLVRSNGSLQKLQVAQEFVDRGELKPFSIENLLLETDLIDYLKDPSNPARSGVDVFRDLVTRGGLHTAEVDVAVTKALLYHHGDLKAVSLQDIGLRRQISSSAALLPITNVSGLSQISDVVLRKAIEAGQDPANQIIQNASANSQAMIDEFRQGKISLSQLRQELSQDTGIRYKMNMIEQSIMEQRDLSSGIMIGSPTQIGKETTIGAFGDFDRLTKRGTTDLRRSLRKKSYLDMYRYGEDVSDADYAAYQTSMQAKQMPFAGLSYEERRIGSAMADITSSAAGQNKPFMADLMMSHFKGFNPLEMKYVTAGTERVTVASSFLSTQGLLNKGDVLGFGIVRPSMSSDQTRINLVKKLNTNEADQLSRAMFDLASDKSSNIDIIRHMNGLGMSMSDEDVVKYFQDIGQLDESVLDEKMAEVSNQFRANIKKTIDIEKSKIINQRILDGLSPLDDAALNDEVVANISSLMQQDGVAIAQISDDAQARQFVELFAQASGQRFEDVADRNMLEIGTAFVDSEPGRVRTAGAFATRGLTDADGKSIISQVDLVLGHQNNLDNMSVIERVRASSLGAAAGAQASDVADRVGASITKNLPLIKRGLLATAGVGAALTIYNKKRNQDIYDETMQQMPMERGTGYSVYDQLEVKKQLGINKYYQTYDPLSTAYTVDQLDRNKIGHTNMGPQRHNNLYGGVL